MKIIILKIVSFIFDIIYSIVKLLPTKKQVVFMSRQANKPSQDFELLGKKVEEKYKVIYLCKTLEGKEKAKPKKVIQYGFHMLKQMYYLATSKIVVLDTYIPTVSILKHKKKTTIIQMWHSNGTMKKFGYTAIEKAEGNNKEIAQTMKMHKNYSIVLCSGKAYVDHLAKGFNVNPSIIKIYSLPRIDLLSDKKYEKNIKKEIYTKYPELKNGKENIVYAPTFRKDESKFSKYVNDLIKEIDTDKYNLIIKLHPLSKVKIKNIKENVVIDKQFTTFDMLFITDKLISDYSCVIYEAGVRNIPLYFYAYDLDKYENIRGLALDYNELPGYTSADPKELAKSLNKKYDMKYLKKFIKKYVENTKGCTQKIADLIDEKMK